MSASSSNSSNRFDPFAMFRWPLSGDVLQRITAPWFSPSLTVNYAGDPRVEDRVVTEVASYGKQLGWLTEIALALAQGQPAPAHTLTRLEEAARRIEAIKSSERPNLRESAKRTLDQLQDSDPQAYAQLLAERLAERQARDSRAPS